MPWDDEAFATDEELAEEATGDIAALMARAQTYAYGTDGSISGWTLTSAGSNFQTQAVAAGMLLEFEDNRTSSTATARRLIGDLFVVHSVTDANNLVFRRQGMESGQGMPPIAASGYQFRVASFAPQVATESDWLRRELDFDEGGDLISDDDRRRVTVYRVLEARYRATTSFAGDKKDHYLAQALMYHNLAAAMLDNLDGRRQSTDAIDSISVVPID